MLTYITYLVHKKVKLLEPCKLIFLIYTVLTISFPLPIYYLLRLHNQAPARKVFFNCFTNGNNENSSRRPLQPPQFMILHAHKFSYILLAWFKLYLIIHRLRAETILFRAAVKIICYYCLSRLMRVQAVSKCLLLFYQVYTTLVSSCAINYL